MYFDSADYEGTVTMKRSIKIIKRKRNDNETGLEGLETKATIKPGPRDIAKTIEGWKTEFLRAKRGERVSFTRLPPLSSEAVG